MRLRLSIQASALLIAAGLLLSCHPVDRSQLPPDVLLITIDTLRADHLSSYGFPYETSPQIDALAKSGVVFETAIAAAGRTIPSHTAIMTSRYTREHSIGYLNGGSRLEGQPTLADRFRDAGYDTAAFVGNVLFTRDTGLDRGFDVFDVELDSSEANRPHVAERQATNTTERTLAWLREITEQHPRKPILLWVHYQDPHGPYAPPTAEVGRFRLRGPPNEKPLPFADDNEGRGIPAYQAIEGLNRISEYRSRYADEIHYADRSIGELIDTFDAATQSRNDARGIVLLTSDHGESFGENGRYFVHTYTTTPDVAHVPLILRAPGLDPARRQELVSHVDILPTLLELSGIEIPEDASGLALGPILRGDATLPRRFVYCDNGSQISAYQDDRFAFVAGLLRAWEVAPGATLDVSLGWQMLRWDGDWRGKRWVRLEDDLLPPAIRRYATRARPMKRLPAAEQDFIRRLRAMGYVEE